MLAGPQWTMLMSASTYRPAATAGTGLRMVSVGSQAELRDPSNQLGLTQGDCLLIRPDGYIGAIFNAAHFGGIDEYLARAFPSAGASPAAAPSNYHGERDFPT